MTKQKKVTEKKITPVPQAAKRPAKAIAKSGTKLGQLEAMLRRPDGATVEQLSKVLHWQVHSVRGAMSGALKKKQGLMLTSEKKADGKRVYRIAA